MQEGPGFVAAVWLEGPETTLSITSDQMDEADDRDRYRDLNYDVPPEIMEGY
jgi:hypothetical protein